jgi:hypothetical protein
MPPQYQKKGIELDARQPPHKLQMSRMSECMHKQDKRCQVMEDQHPWRTHDLRLHDYPRHISCDVGNEIERKRPTPPLGVEKSKDNQGDGHRQRN